jgi:hypothetical protein
MGKLFFTENQFKRSKQRITQQGRKDESVRIMFERKEVPPIMDESVYGQALTQSSNPWYSSNPWRAKWDAHVKIGDFAITMDAQELYNLVQRLNDSLQTQERLVRSGGYND